MIFLLHNKPYNNKNALVQPIQYNTLKDLIIIILQIRQFLLDYDHTDDIVILDDNKELKTEIEYLIKYVFNVLDIKLVNSLNNFSLNRNYKDKLISRTFGTEECSNTYYTLFNHLTQIDSFGNNNTKVTKALSAITFIDLITIKIPKNLISKQIIDEINNKSYMVDESDYNKWAFNCNKFTRLELLQIPLHIIKTNCKTILSNQNIDIVIILCELNYHRDNAFHNFNHAVDVLQATLALIKPMEINEADKFTLLISTLFHDACHNGNNNAILSKSKPIHNLIGDSSLLENIHYKLLYHLFVNLMNINLINNLNHKLRSTHLKLNSLDLNLSKDLILATDMQRHNAYLKILEEPLSYGNLLQVIIKAADISNVTRPLLISTQWAYRISKEFESYEILDKDKQNDMFDDHVLIRELTIDECIELQPNLPKGQIFFIETFAMEFFEAMEKQLVSKNIIFKELMTNLKSNYAYWQKKVSQSG